MAHFRLTTIKTLNSIHEAIEIRADLRESRGAIFASRRPLAKLAFDTRRINQETTYIPRRNLQNYHRSAEFIDDEMAAKIKLLAKVKTATSMLKEQFGYEPEWLDSYARVLDSTLDRVLRLQQKDGDLSPAQLSYAEELLYVRYRLGRDDITKLSEREIEKIILQKDEPLNRKEVFAMIYRPEEKPGQTNNRGIESHAIVEKRTTEHSMIEGILKDVKATNENRDVERTVSITVRDKLHDPKINKEG